MSKAGRRIIFFIIVLFGLVVFNYPNIATFVNNLTANREISEYQESIQEADTTWIEHEMELAYAYNQSLPMSFPADPFSQSNIRSFTGTEFEHFDMVQDGAVIGYVEVPSINICLPVYYGTSDEVLEKGLGLVENTSLPVGGEGTHSVISGHTGMASRKLFTDLNLVKEGEVFFLHVLDQHFAYKVNQIKVVLPHETQDLIIERDHDYVTLLTCTPFGINDHRLLVRGERTEWDFTPEKIEHPVVRTLRNPNEWKWLAALGGAVFVLLIAVLRMIIDSRREKKKRAAAKKAEAEASAAEASPAEASPAEADTVEDTKPD